MNDIAELLLCPQLVECRLFQEGFKHDGCGISITIIVERVIPDCLAGRVWLIGILVRLFEGVDSPVLQFHEPKIVEIVFCYGLVVQCFLGDLDHVKSIVGLQVPLDQPCDVQVVEPLLFHLQKLFVCKCLERLCHLQDSRVVSVQQLLMMRLEARRRLAEAPVAQTAQSSLFASLKELARWLEVFDVAEDIGVKLIIRLIVAEESEADALKVPAYIELDPSDFCSVSQFPTVFIDHILPAGEENVRFNCLREHQVVSLQLAFRKHEWLIELVVLLEPNVA